MSISSTSSTSYSSLETLVQQYMAIERQAVTKYESERTSLKARSSTYDTLDTYLTKLQDIAENFNDEDNSIFDSVSVTSSDTSAVDATGSDDATIGSYALRVRQLATATSMNSAGKLNTANSVVSSLQVISGSEGIDVDKSWADAGFDEEPTGSVTFNTGHGAVEFTLSDYETVEDFMDAVNSDANARVNIYYDEDKDKFVIEADDPTDMLSMYQSVDNGFLYQAKIADESSGQVINDTIGHDYYANNSGIQTDVFLYQANFDNDLAESDSGSFKINGVTFNWDADDDTFEGIINDINSSKAGVTAFYDESLNKISITSNSTGSEAIQYEDVEGTFLSNTLKLGGVTQNLGLDALFTINSTDSVDEIAKSSNEFTLNGITFNLKEVTVENDDYTDTDTKAVNIKAEKDDTKITKNINNFITEFNSVIDYLKKQTSVDLTTYTRGSFASESSIRYLRSDFINIMLSEVTGGSSGDPATLAELGITFDSDMHLEVSDTDKLSDAISADLQAVKYLFTSENGFTTRIFDILDNYTDDDDGIIEQKKDIIQDQVETVNKRIDRLEAQLELKEIQYRNDLSTMQSLLNQSVQQYDLVTSIMGYTSNILG